MSEATTAVVGEVAPPPGLSEAEAARILVERGPPHRPPTSRSYASIVRANVLTVFNLVLAVFGGLTLAFGEWCDALFLGVLLANSAIGITQEVRAKRALDRLAALVAPRATVVRDGAAREVPVAEVVPGDLVRVQAGDQFVADGRLSEATQLRLDESVLTGESRTVARAASEEVRSGSFAAAGTGAYLVTAVGADSYAERIAGVARTFRHPRSPLERALNRLLLYLCASIAPLGLVLGYALWERKEPLHSAVPTTVAAVVTLVPEGLIPLTSLTYAVAALRMARRGALAQQLNAIESLASVDVVCIDKTGTLTDGQPRVVGLLPAAGLAATASAPIAEAAVRLPPDGLRSGLRHGRRGWRIATVLRRVVRAKGAAGTRNVSVSSNRAGPSDRRRRRRVADEATACQDPRLSPPQEPAADDRVDRPGTRVAGAARRDDRGESRTLGGLLPGRRCPRLGAPGAAPHLPGVRCRCRRGRPRAAGTRHRAGRPRRHLEPELRRVGAGAVRDGRDRRHPRHRQPGVPGIRARVRAPAVRCLGARRRGVLPRRRLPDAADRGRPGPAAAPACQLPRHRRLGRPAPRRRCGRPLRRGHQRRTATAGRPDQHPVHERHHGVPQGRDAQPPQHPQQRVLRRRGVRLHERRPRLHPGASLPLLRHGDGQPRLHVARRLHGVPYRGFNAAATLDACAGERSTSLYGVPTIFIAELADPQLAERDLSSLRTEIMAGAPCPVEVMKQVMTRLNMAEVTIAYGMTETSPVSVQTSRNDALERRVSTVGTVHPHLEVKIVDPAGGEAVARGERGELCTRGYSVMLGYWDEPERTAEVIDADGWLHSGDLATMDSDGYVKIVGRIKDMIVRGGENVYPREVEECLHRHPSVQDAQVIGVPDARLGEEVMAWIQLRDGAQAVEEEIREYCRAHIARYKVPRYIHFVDAFPMTVTGKIQKFKMREQAIRDLGLEDAAAIETA